MFGPVVRIEIEGLKQSVLHHLAKDQRILNDHIEQELEKVLNQEWIAEEVNKSVTKNLQKAIEGLSTNYDLTRAFQEAIVEMVNKSLSKDD